MKLIQKHYQYIIQMIILPSLDKVNVYWKWIENTQGI